MQMPKPNPPTRSTPPESNTKQSKPRQPRHQLLLTPLRPLPPQLAGTMQNRHIAAHNLIHQLIPRPRIIPLPLRPAHHARRRGRQIRPDHLPQRAPRRVRLRRRDRLVLVFRRRPAVGMHGSDIVLLVRVPVVYPREVVVLLVAAGGGLHGAEALRGEFAVLRPRVADQGDAADGGADGDDARGGGVAVGEMAIVDVGVALRVEVGVDGLVIVA